MKPVEYRERRGDVRDDRPRPEPVEVPVDRIRIGLVILEDVHREHGYVADKQEGDEFACRLATHVILRQAVASQRVQNEDRLDGGLYEDHEVGQDGQDGVDVVLDRKMAADESKDAEHVYSALRNDEQHGVQVDVTARIVLQLPNLYGGDEDGEQREEVDAQFAYVQFEDGQLLELGLVDEHVEQDEADQAHDEYEYAEEEPLVGVRAVDLVVAALH